MDQTKVLLSTLFLLVLLTSACGDDDESINTNDFTIWSGPTTTFVKADGADPSLAENQDRITDNVWITRGNEGGQIYNIVLESEADKNTSPTGTSWAQGTTANLDNLQFTPFREAVVRPQEAVGLDLVMLLVDDKIAIDVKFTRWGGGQVGGFTYERSTE